MHIIGKDIARFHAVYWPGFLLSAGLPLPSRIIGHDHFTSGSEGKMSKSLGNVVDPEDILASELPDVLRGYLIHAGPRNGTDVAYADADIRGFANTMNN